LKYSPTTYFYYGLYEEIRLLRKYVSQLEFQLITRDVRLADQENPTMRTKFTVTSIQLRSLLLAALVVVGAWETGEAQQNGTFSIVPSFGKGGLVGSNKANEFGFNSPTGPSVVPDITSPAAKPSGEFGKSPTKGGIQVIVGTPNSSSQGGAVGNFGGQPSGAANLPLGIVQQVKELVGKNGIATQSTLKGASNLVSSTSGNKFAE
jgi:hypothetical protein